VEVIEVGLFVTLVFFSFYHAFLNKVISKVNVGQFFSSMCS